MKHYSTPIGIILFLTVAAGVWADAPQDKVKYYKAGNVGAFCAEVQIPDDVSTELTVFTANTEDKKIHLLFIDAPQSAANRLNQAMSGSSNRSPYTPEQMEQLRKFDEDLAELYMYQGENSRQLNQRTKKIEVLQQLKSESEAQGGVENEKLAAGLAERIKQEQQLVDAFKLEGEAVADQLNKLNDQRMELFSSVSLDQQRAVQAPADPSTIKVYGRFQGQGPVLVTVLAREAGELLAEPRTIDTVVLVLPAADGGDPELLKQWATARAREYAVRVADSPYTSYYQYCLMQSRKKYGVAETYLERALASRNDNSRRDRQPNLYAISTGAAAIQESLQLDRMTAGDWFVPTDRTVALNELSGPQIKSHPFAEMLEGRTSKAFPTAALIPYDNYYCHFSSITSQLAATDLMREWGTSLLRSLTVSARDSDLPERYENQLCLEIDGLTRLFGEMVIGEIAFTGGDPFLREGSDFAAIIEVRQPQVFDTLTDGYAKAMTATAFPDAHISTSDYQGVEISSMQTHDRRLSSHSAYLGAYKVYANTLELLQQIIDTSAQRRRSLAEELDFQYMRTIFPGEASAEDGFIYLSDAHIRKLLSPRWKIENQRRLTCQTQLRMITNAAAMYRAEMRREPTIANLIADNYLDRAATVCPDGGVYSLIETGAPLDLSGQAQCSCHNCLQYCTPIASVEVDSATPKEAADYQAFVREYSSYWSRFFDPIGIRLTVGDHIEWETCILPLIENSIYNQVRELIGGQPVKLDSRALTDGTLFSVTTKLNLSDDMRGGLREIQRDLFPTQPPIENCLGDNLSFGLYDSDVLFTFDSEGMDILGGFMNLEQQLFIAVFASSINLPIYATIDLKDQAQAKAIIREGLKTSERMLAAEGGGEVALEHYAAESYMGHEVNTIAWRLFFIKFRLHYATANNCLVVSTKRYVLEHVLDELDRRHGALGDEETANLRIDIQPQAFGLLRPAVRTGWQERMRDACLKNIEPVRALIENYGATPETLEAISRRVTGVTMRCPAGGEYRYDAKREMVYCTVHGDIDHPRQPLALGESEGVLRLLERMRNFSIDFRFTEEGLMTKVVLDLEPHAIDR